jgi:hypothetical protein
MFVFGICNIDYDMFRIRTIICLMFRNVYISRISEMLLTRSKRTTCPPSRPSLLTFVKQICRIRSSLLPSSLCYQIYRVRPPPLPSRFFLIQNIPCSPSSLSPPFFSPKSTVFALLSLPSYFFLQICRVRPPRPSRPPLSFQISVMSGEGVLQPVRGTRRKLVVLLNTL